MAINLAFEKLSLWQKVAFGAGLLERMLPNYQIFSDTAGFGETKVLRNQLDLIWQWLDKSSSCKINYDAQLTKLEPQIPDPEEFDTFGVFPALDVCMALMSLLQGMQDKSGEGLNNVARLSENSVSYYVELLLAQEDETQQVSADKIAEHPLMQWECATQHEVFDFLLTSPENKASCKKIKSLVLEEGMSNLGIEI